MTQLAAGTACAPHFTEIRVTVGRERRAPRLNATALPAVGPACSLVRATAWTLVHASTVALVRCMCLSREAVACARLVCLGPNSCVVRINLVAAQSVHSFVASLAVPGTAFTRLTSQPTYGDRRKRRPPHTAV